MFTFKKLVYSFFLPMPISLLLCALGLIFLWTRKRETYGKWLVTCGIFLLLLFSLQPISDMLLSGLEQQMRVSENISDKRVSFIVVLCGDGTINLGISAASQASDQSLKRLVDALFLYREFPGRKLIISGGGWPSTNAPAVLLEEFARKLGIPGADILVESESRCTADQARLLEPLLHAEPFFLVTSASHMPRALGTFRKHGLRAIPFASDFRAKGCNFSDIRTYLPRGHALEQSENAVYEYLGLAWYNLTKEM